MPIRLIALDLDDTLLDPDLQISPASRQAISRVRQLGIVVTIATGRMFRSARPYALQLGLEVPLITYEGALVQHSDSEEVLYSRPVPSGPAGQVLDYFKEAGVHFHTYFEDRLVMEQLTPEGAAYAQLAGVKPVIFPDLKQGLKCHQAMKIMAISHHEPQLLDMQRELESCFGQGLHITRSKTYFLEVMHPQADKARALQVIADYFGFGPHEVMAIGDSFNDLEMISWAGVGVAMGNALPVVKQRADFVTGSNREDGVAMALGQLILERQAHGSERVDEAG